MSATNNPSGLGNFVVHLHGACTHPYCGENFHDVWLNDEYSGQDDEGRWYIVLMHPRWCPECIQQRSETIFMRYEQRLGMMDAHIENVRIEISYLGGVRDGRIDALSISFNQLPFWEVPNATEDIEEIDELMEAMSVGPRSRWPVEKLAELMGQQSLGADELEEEIEQCLKEEEAYQCGFMEGMKEQATMEWNALFAEMGTRDEMFAMALA